MSKPSQGYTLDRRTPCSRCGLLRKVNAGRQQTLCKDCIDTLNPKQRKAWQ